MMKIDEVMQVIVVIGGYDYEGCSFDSLKLFDCKSAPAEYKNHLQHECNYDSLHIQVKSVDMNSAIVAA